MTEEEIRSSIAIKIQLLQELSKRIAAQMIKLKKYINFVYLYILRNYLIKSVILIYKSDVVVVYQSYSLHIVHNEIIIFYFDRFNVVFRLVFSRSLLFKYLIQSL